MDDQRIFELVKGDDLSGLRDHLDSGGDVNAGDDQSWTPLNFAAGKGNLAMVKLLIERGADVFKVGRDNRTPYMIALAAGRVEVVKYLREIEDATDAEKAKSFRPERKYCKAYQLGELRKFPGWSESKINWKRRDSAPGREQTAEELSDSKVVFIHQDFTVTESMWHDENVIFDKTSSEWHEFCRDTLNFRVPGDLDLIANSASNQ